jgi:hypothetical protein
MRLDAVHSEEEGYSTAELLANAALAIGALIAIWGAMEALGVNVMTWIGTRLNGAIG